MVAPHSTATQSRQPIDPSTDPKITLRVAMSSPVPNAQLDSPRRGEPVAVQLSVKASNVAVTQVSVIVQQDGDSELVFNAVSPATGSQILVNVTFHRSGVATLIGRVTGKTWEGDSIVKQTDAMQVSILPTERKPIAIMLDGNKSIVAVPDGRTIAASFDIVNPTKRADASLDNWATKIPIELKDGAAQWSFWLPPDAPKSYQLLVREVDFFDVESVTELNFVTTEQTPPLITVASPFEDQVFIRTVPFDLEVSGTVVDVQSGFKAGTLTYSYAQDVNKPLDVSGNIWTLKVRVTSYGPQNIAFRAEDKLGNKAVVRRQFNVVSSYKPKSVDELLSPRAYLEALLQFVGSHVLDANNNLINPDELTRAFKQPFGLLAQPETRLGEQIFNDLQIPVSLMREAGPASTTGLIASWHGKRETFLQDMGPYAWASMSSRGAVPGARGGDEENAISFDGVGDAVVPNFSGLEIGRDNRDFSVMFWLYLRDHGTPGAFRGVLYKGHESDRPNSVNRTFSVLLHPNENKIRYQISLASSSGANTVHVDGDSRAEVSPNRWTHVAYVKRASHLELYVNGELDSKVLMQGSVLSNTDPLIIGKAPELRGINGALDEIRVYGSALTKDGIQRLASSRESNYEPWLDVFYSYPKRAYEYLLIGIGTSYEELRSLMALTPVSRNALAERVGLRKAGNQGDYLEDLLQPTGVPIDIMAIEPWLEEVFGLPSTRSVGSAAVKSKILGWRQEDLIRRWSEQDYGAFTSIHKPPYLEPDLVDIDDLDRKQVEIRAMLRSRKDELDVLWRKLIRFSRGEEAIKEVLSADELARLARLRENEDSGMSISGDLSLLGLDVPMYRRLLVYIGLATQISEREQTDLAHLLVQLWKVRKLYPRWKDEEQARHGTLWPNTLGPGAFVLRNDRREFDPWRGSLGRRQDWEQRVVRRLDEWQHLEQGYDQMVLNVAAQCLPLLRDALLGMDDLETNQDAIDQQSERLLVDIGATGTTSLSRIDQATLSLQTLINGLRTKRFAPDHKSFAWSLRTEWETEPTSDPNLASFDEEWRWIGTYDRWRAAAMAFLYPENALWPAIRASSEAYQKVLRQFRERGSADSSDFVQMAQEEQTYFIYMAIGIDQQRFGLMNKALDAYRRVYDWNQAPDQRAIAPLLKSEAPVAPTPVFDDRWTLIDLDPHVNAKGKSLWGNPYTKFTLARVVECLLSSADEEFSAGTLDSRTRALSLYLDARQILSSEALAVLAPETNNPAQAYLPNPVFETLRLRTAAAIGKLRRGLTILGTPGLPDPSRGGARISAISTSVRSSYYHFRVLLERAKLLVTLAKQLEVQYLSALEKRDVTEEQFRREGFTLALADETVTLRTKQLTEVARGQKLARLQQTRIETQRDRYREWINTGQNEHERTQIDELWKAKTQRDIIGGIDAALTAAQGVPGLVDVIATGGVALIKAELVAIAAAGKAVAQGFMNASETQSQVSSILASQERRKAEWQLQLDLANRDLAIGEQQILLSQDRVDIASQELNLATLQRGQARDMLIFLSSKFTNTEFYEWLIGVLAEIYAFFLRLATTAGQLAEAQLAFERQEPRSGLIQSSYWQLASRGTLTSPIDDKDRRGITGSSRLLQDIYTLDQRAFESQRRLLNVSQTFSLETLFPLEFQEFRRTGRISFSTAAEMFDIGFPGHFMRLIKRVRVTVAALIPPSQGIRATLGNSGISRVVTAEPGFPTVMLRQESQSVALSSPSGSTGVFEFDVQGDLQAPFEGVGVDTQWYFDLPPAANPFDFDTIVDVLVSIDYTALSSQELRERVIRTLPRRVSADRVWSVRRDYPDVWYELTNQATTESEIEVQLDRRAFPPQLEGIAIEEVVLAIRTRGGKPPPTNLRVGYTTPIGLSVKSTLDVPMVDGVMSTRQVGALALRAELLSEDKQAIAAASKWRFVLSSAAGSADALRVAFQEDRIDDVLLVFTFAGLRPVWS